MPFFPDHFHTAHAFNRQMVLNKLGQANGKYNSINFYSFVFPHFEINIAWTSSMRNVGVCSTPHGSNSHNHTHTPNRVQWTFIDFILFFFSVLADWTLSAYLCGREGISQRIQCTRQYGNHHNVAQGNKKWVVEKVWFGVNAAIVANRFIQIHRRRQHL